jgi:hypothetical protein
MALQKSGTTQIVAALVLVISLIATAGSSQKTATATESNWAAARMGEVQLATGLPVPTDIAGLLDFAEISTDVDTENYCLAQAIYFEARGEAIEGQFAVGRVIKNRVEDTRYPDTICGVVFQNQDWIHRCQFSFACDRASDNPKEMASWAMARRLANLVQASWVPNEIGAATHYHATYVQPGWAERMDRIALVGDHIFYREEPRQYRH